MIGRGSRMRQVYQLIESGRAVRFHRFEFWAKRHGQRLASRAIHLNSPRKLRPFVALKLCRPDRNAARKRTLRHDAGVHTARSRKRKASSKWPKAAQSFLDEVAELPPRSGQAPARLQEREFVRLGGTCSIKLNVRFIAATNKDLRKRYRRKIRLDLFYRLKRVSITMPLSATSGRHPSAFGSLRRAFIPRAPIASPRTLSGRSSLPRPIRLAGNYPRA